MAAAPSQSPKPVAHAATAQAPAAHVGAALAKVHTVAHAPQWVAVTRVSVSQPLSGLLSQSPKPPAQVPTTHTPARQAGVAPAGEGHRWPQAPQFSMSLSTRVSQPLSARMSQLA